MVALPTRQMSLAGSMVRRLESTVCSNYSRNTTLRRLGTSRHTPSRASRSSWRKSEMVDTKCNSFATTAEVTYELNDRQRVARLYPRTFQCAFRIGTTQGHAQEHRRLDPVLREKATGIHSALLAYKQRVDPHIGGVWDCVRPFVHAP